MGNSEYAVYGDFDTFKNIKLRVKRGSVTCIAGPGDTGKSSLINILADVVRTKYSCVEYNGLKLSENNEEIRRKVSFVFDRINFNLNTKPIQLAKEIMALEEYFDYEYFIKKLNAMHFNEKVLISKYTREMKTKLKIILAISRRPEILILDEPFDNVDFECRENILEILEEFMKNENHTIIFTHDTSVDDRYVDDDDLIEFNNFNRKLKDLSDEIIMIDTGEVILVEKISVHDNIISNDNHIARSSHKISHDESPMDGNELNTSVYKQRYFVKWYRIIGMYYVEGTSSTRLFRGLINSIALLFIASFLTGMITWGHDNISMLGWSVIWGIFGINKTFEDRKSLCLNLSISQKNHVKYAYISVAFIVLILLGIIYIIGIIDLLFSKDSIQIGDSVTVSGILYLFFLSILILFMYLPLVFIKRKIMWWFVTVISSGLLFFVNTVVINSLPIVSGVRKIKFSANILTEFNKLPNYPLYLIAISALCVVVAWLSYKISCYFLKVE